MKITRGQQHIELIRVQPGQPVADEPVAEVNNGQGMQIAVVRVLREDQFIVRKNILQSEYRAPEARMKFRIQIVQPAFHLKIKPVVAVHGFFPCSHRYPGLCSEGF